MKKDKEVLTKGRWIENPNFGGKSVSRFNREFNIKAGLKSARLYVAAAGFFQGYINGQGVDTEYFKPVLTDFVPRKQLRLADEFNGGRKKLSYYTYDIENLLKTGKNRLDILLGGGYYHNVEKDDLDPSFSFGTPKLVFELCLDYGTKTEVIASGEDCLVSTTNRKSQLFGGDFIDYTARDGKSVKARLAEPYSGELIFPQVPADAVMREYVCDAPVMTENGAKRYDFGVNHTGGLLLRMSGVRGTRVIIRYAEVLDEIGDLNVLTGGWPCCDLNNPRACEIIQKSEFILSGGIDEFSPLFCFHCYRYAEITADAPLEILDIKSLFICTPLARDGNYSFGVSGLDNFSEVYAHTQLCASHCGVPMDCPHREKLPYTGDGWLTLESALYLFDAERFYSKWLDDILDAQGKSGFVPYTAPYISGGGGYAWGNAIVEVPMLLYRHTGDIAYIKRALSNVLKWVGYYEKRSGVDGAVRGTEETWLLGDWLSPNYSTFDVVFMSTLCRFRALTLAAEMCEIAGEIDKAESIKNTIEWLRNQINTKFYNPVTHNYMSGKQGENIIPVAYGIPEANELLFILENIRKLYEDELNCHLDTGIVSTPLLFEVLTAHGMKDLAFKIFTQNDYPSFFNMLEGETTLCEHWSKKFPDYIGGEGKITKGGAEASHCHPMFGSVAAWIYKHVTGMDLSRLYRKEIIFAPKFCGEVLKVSASKMLNTGAPGSLRPTMYGEAGISYENNGQFIADITVPAGFTGICILENVLSSVKINGACEFSIAAEDRRAEFKLPSGAWQVKTVMSANAKTACGGEKHDFINSFSQAKE